MTSINNRNIRMILFITSLLLYSTERKEKHYNSVFFIQENFPCLLSVINYVFWEQTLKDNYMGNFTFYCYSKYVFILFLIASSTNKNFFKCKHKSY